MTDLVPAVVFPPGEYIKEALEARGWTREEFAEIIGRTAKFVGELIHGDKAITPRTAKELAAALGTSAMLWLNLDAAYRLHHSQEPVPIRITRQARLRERFAVREMVKRRWIEASDDPEVLEAQVLRFFDISHIDEEPRLAHAARKIGYPADISGPQRAWLFRVKQIADAMVVPEYSERALREAMPVLASLRDDPESIRHVPHILSQCGVRFVIVEHVPSSKIDGVCFWLNDKKSPVVGMSLRLDRIDNFWFVLRHECEHVLRKHGRDEAIVDRDVASPDSTQSVRDEEIIANTAAGDFCVPKAEMEDFMMRHRPPYSEEKVVKFARSMQVHPGLVVGQLQNILKDFRLFKKFQISVRPLVAPYSVTDGYGQVVPNSL